MAKTTDRLHEYARLGAAIRRAEIVAELHAASMSGELDIASRDFTKMTDIGMAVTARHLEETIANDDDFPVQPWPTRMAE